MVAEVYVRPGKKVELCVMPEGWNHQHPVVVPLSPQRARHIAIDLLKLAEEYDEH